MTDRLEVTVRGLVQGVGFRWYVVRAARRLGVTGWTANNGDGSVRVVAEGSPAALDDLLVELRHGPAGAQIEALDEHRLMSTGEFRGFTIRAAGHRGD